MWKHIGSRGNILGLSCCFEVEHFRVIMLVQGGHVRIIMLVHGRTLCGSMLVQGGTAEGCHVGSRGNILGLSF